MADQQPLTPDFVADLDKIAEETTRKLRQADKLGAEIVKKLDFTRPDGTTAHISLSRDTSEWIESLIRKRVNRKAECSSQKNGLP